MSIEIFSKKNAMFLSIGSILNMNPCLAVPHVKIHEVAITSPKDDVVNLAQDWFNIGQDLYTAMDAYEKENK